MPKRKIPDSLLPPDVEAAVLEQLRAIYSGAPVPPALSNPDPHNRAYLYEGTKRAPPRAKTKRLSKAQAQKLRQEYDARVETGEIDPDELVYPDPNPWARRTIIRKRRKVNGRWVWVYRIKGQAGADLQVDPGYMELLKRQRDIDAATVKATRRPPKHAPAHSREHIRTIAATIPEGRGRIKAIARAAGCSVDTVRRALSQ